MILVFGGTTEGRKAAEVLEEGGPSFFYSTKTGEQDISLHHGQPIHGALDAAAMTLFCREHDIRLIVDAAHPFAVRLHQTIAGVAASMHIPVVRYERIYPQREPDITWIDDYSQVPTDIHTLLATTGVQSIGKLQYLESLGLKVVYRILPRESSRALARAQGAADSQLCYYEDSGSIDVDADAILLKESGLSGGFTQKVEAARAKGMRIIALKRPELTCQFTVNGPHGLRRMVERLLPEFYPLHSGLTTGTCATAAAIAATKRLMEGQMPPEVPVLLPNGETISVAVGYGPDYAFCVKEAGDDPDVTDGIEVRATVSRSAPGTSLTILGGEGVGRFTLPGFDYPPGEPAINRGPRQMICQNLTALAAQQHPTATPSAPPPLTVTIAVPGGQDIARHTFNPRLGIEGGISIIGVSGIVSPFSEEAFINSIRKCMEVARASGTDHVVINSGAKSERFLKQRFDNLPPQAFVQYGNYIGETLRMAADLAIPNVTLGVMLGKAVKLAAGHLDTHSQKATMDKDFIRQLLDESRLCIDIGNITLARELWERIPPHRIPDFVSVVIAHCTVHSRPLLPHGHLTILLIDDDGHIFP